MANKNLLKKLACMTAATAMAFSAIACGGNNDNSSSTGGGKRENETKIVIYTGGSSEYSWTEGSEEADVIDYIEQKYHEDTGVWLDFKISHLSESMRTKLNSDLSSGVQVDIAISHTRGGSGIDDYVVGQEIYYDIADDIDDFAPNLAKYIKGDARESLTDVNGHLIGVPSVINPYKYGILVRKDWMEACKFTDDAAKAAGGEYTLVDDLQSFKDMCLAMKEKYNLSYVVSGAPWDLEKVTIGAFGDAGYFTYGVRNDKVLPGYLTDEYAEMLNYEYSLSSNNVTSTQEADWLLEQSESAFIGGNTGVFITDPTVQHLISVARKTKSADKSAEFTVLGPMTKDDASTEKGFMANTTATFAAVVLKNSTNSMAIAKFLNWVYKNADNYNLCRYGIEGKHWVNNGDGTYSYPAGKEDYLVKAPYSGILTLVENQNISNLTYKGYTAEETAWIKNAAKKENYIDNDLVNYMWPLNKKISESYSNAIGKIYAYSALPAWNGNSDPKTTFDNARNLYLSSGGQEYVDYITDAYKIMKTKRG